MNHIFTFICLFLILSGGYDLSHEAMNLSQSTPLRNLHADSGVVTDALGRSLPSYDECGACSCRTALFRQLF